MSDRRFHAGDCIDVPPMQYRVVPGRKQADDLLLQWRYVGPWESVTLDQCAVILDAIAENEDALYPPERGYQGNAYVVKFCKMAIAEGHGRARYWLQHARARKHDPGAYA